MYAVVDTENFEGGVLDSCWPLAASSACRIDLARVYLVRVDLKRLNSFFSPLSLPYPPFYPRSLMQYMTVVSIA